jgi:hypothetical protein
MNQSDDIIESLLARYRPTGPPPGLRSLVLSSALPSRPRWRVAAWLSVAAMLVLTLGLHLAATRVMRATAAAADIGRIEWSTEAEEAARMLNGDGAGRRYVALALAAGGSRREGFPPPPTGLALIGETQ